VPDVWPKFTRLVLRLDILKSLNLENDNSQDKR